MERKIGIFRALHLGDMLCIIPTVRAIRAAWPDAHMTLIGLPWQDAFVERFPFYFNDFIAFPGWPGLPEQQPDPRKVVAFLRHMQEREFDIVFQMQGNGAVTNGMCELWGAEIVCGLRVPRSWTSNPQYFPESDDSEHEVLRFFKLLECFNITPQGSHLEFPITDEEDQLAQQKMAEMQLETGSFICIHPGARDERRRWPAQHFASIADALARDGYRLLLTGSEDEHALLAKVAQLIDGPVINIVDRFGHLPIGELAAILRRSRLLISNDTGVSHVAAALSVPSVIIFSPWSDMRRWHPLSEELHMSVPHEQSGDIDFVLSRINELLTRSKASATSVGH